NSDGTGDPYLAHTFTRDGRYAVLVTDAQSAGSNEHTYRLNAGALPLVTGVYPLSVAANAVSEVELIGINLPAERKVKVQAGANGEAVVPIDREKFRPRREFKVVVDPLPAVLEAEPNDTPAQAQAVAAPASIGGRIGKPGDVDLFRFDAKQGSVWAL